MKSGWEPKQRSKKVKRTVTAVQAEGGGGGTEERPEASVGGGDRIPQEARA